MQMGRGIRGRFKAAMPAMSMVLAQIVFAGLNILYKIAVDRGMSLRVLVTYRFIVGAAFLAPMALFLERRNRERLTPLVLVESFCCGLFGGSLAQNLYIASMKMTSASFVSAMSNLQPTFTFILAIIFRMERLAIRKAAGQAKIVGTLIGLGGAMLLSFYRGANIQSWSVQTHLLHHPDRGGSKATGNRALGSLLAVGSTLCYSVWLILQARLSEHYPHPYTSTALLCLMAAVQSACFAGICDKEAAAWKLRWDVKLLTVIYAGVMVSGLMLTVSSWCVQKRGPLFVAVFNPLMLIIVVVFSSLFLNETLHLGSVLGGALIVIGLYVVLWGKGKEKQEMAKLPSRRSVTQATTTTAASASICPESSSSLSSDGQKPGVSGEV
ncbi:WAT1-related protein At1g68170-like [Nymphaea colorata]|nr:WAT1-related protein At1g68170-like [Nymphaea colorata]